MYLLKIPTVLHMFCLVRVFLKITLKASLKVLLYVLEGFAILMRNLKSILQNIKTIARDYKPGKVKKQFSDIKKLTREEAKKTKLLKTTFSTSCNLITQHNLLFPNLKTIIRKHLPILYSNQQMLDIYPHNTISVTCKRI